MSIGDMVKTSEIITDAITILLYTFCIFFRGNSNKNKILIAMLTIDVEEETKSAIRKFEHNIVMIFVFKCVAFLSSYNIINMLMENDNEAQLFFCPKKKYLFPLIK
jgi:hypothetical protein